MDLRDERIFNRALSLAIGYIQKRHKQILYPLNTLKTNPDSYVTLVNILLTSALISPNEARSILRPVLRNQRKDGSWPEILARGHAEEKSVVFTATVGCQLFNLIQTCESFRDELLNRLKASADFVVSREIGDGWFRKSENVLLDTINVNALASLFLVKCYNAFRQNKYLTASLRGVKRVIKSQRPDGEFPYYTDQPEIPSVFYHSITTNCLSKLNKIHPDTEIQKSTVKGGLWMEGRQMSTGRFSWKASVDHWAYRSFVTYPLVMELFADLAHYKEDFDEAFQRTLRYILLSQAEDGSFPVKDSFRTLRVLLEDIENVTTVIHARPKLFPLSMVRSARMTFHGLRGPIGPFSYQLLNGGRNYNEDVFLSTVETVDRLVKCLRFDT